MGDFFGCSYLKVLFFYGIRQNTKEKKEFLLQIKIKESIMKD